LSDAPVSYAFEQLEPTAPPPRDAPARVIAKAMAEADAIRERARSEGFEQGLAAGRNAGAGEAARAAQALREAAEGVHALGRERALAVERDAVELALSLAAKVLGGALQARPELVVEAVQGALRRIVDRRRVTVLVSPADLAPVEAAIGALTAQGSGVELCDLQADQRLQRGSAVVRTVEGEVDAGVATQLERAREVVAASLAPGESAPLEAGEASS